MIKYKYLYRTPEGFSDIILIGNGSYLTGLYFEDSRFTDRLTDCVSADVSAFSKTVDWLDMYFSGSIPDFFPDYKIDFPSAFRFDVSSVLTSVAYGQVVSYGEIANIIGKTRGITKMSARAVGQAVGWNPISIIIPCHRVIGADGRITGYSGGINNKIKLLQLENHCIQGHKLLK